jgi:hypothetical protein
MNRVERWVLRFWWLITALAALALFMPILLILLLFGIVTVPLAMLGLAAPTLWLYLTPSLLIYALLRQAPRTRHARRWLLAAAACALPLAVGFAVPVLANQRLDARLGQLMAQDGGSVPKLEPVRTAAYLSSTPGGWEDSDRKCFEFCQRLLFSGLAQAVIVGPAPPLGKGAPPPFINGARPREGSAAAPLTLHEIVPMGAGCDNKLLAAVRADRRDSVAKGPEPFLWEKLDDLAREGRCFRSRAVGSADADVRFVDIHEDPYWFPPSSGYDLRLIPIGTIERREIYRRRGGRQVLILRRTRIGYQRLAAPLTLTPWTDFETGRPGHWGYASAAETGVEAGYGSGRFLTNDLKVTGLEPETAVVNARPRSN